MLAPDVQEAIAQARQALAGHTIDVVEDGQGGVRVTVHDLPLGDQYVPGASWVGFAIGFQYPASDVYPHFVRGDLSRADGRPLGEALTTGHMWNGGPAIQVSRRSPRWDRDTDTAVMKLAKVLEWIRSR